MNVIFVVVTTHLALTVPVYPMVITWKIIVVIVMQTQEMTVYRIVQEHGVAV